MFAPEPRQRSEDRDAVGSRRVCKKWTEKLNTISRFKDFSLFSPFFFFFCSSWLLSAWKKKNQSYIQVNFISTQSAFVQRSLKRKRMQERRKARREHTGMKAKCINSPPILLLCCDRLSNMQAHFLCQRLDEGSQERTLWVSLSLPRLFLSSPLNFSAVKL